MPLVASGGVSVGCLWGGCGVCVCVVYLWSVCVCGVSMECVCGCGCGCGVSMECLTVFVSSFDISVSFFPSIANNLVDTLKILCYSSSHRSKAMHERQLDTDSSDSLIQIQATA